MSGSTDDSLRHSRSRINAYRALASPSLIALSSKDPILTSFELSWELRRLSKLENEFKLDYEKLAKKCQEFAVDLLDQIRGSKELEVILNHDTTNPACNEGGQEVEPKPTDKLKLSRLKLAIKFKQKKVLPAWEGYLGNCHPRKPLSTEVKQRWIVVFEGWQFPVPSCARNIHHRCMILNVDKVHSIHYIW